jgi:hypothetical protein
MCAGMQARCLVAQLRAATRHCIPVLLQLRVTAKSTIAADDSGSLNVL